SFDAEGRCTEARGLDGRITRNAVAPDAITRTGPDGVVERWERDGDGRVLAHAVEGGPRLAFEYPDRGVFPSRLSRPEGWEMRIEVTHGLVTSLTDADGVAVRIDHDADGNVVAVTNALGAATATEPHVSGLPARITRPDGTVVAIERDPAGRMRTVRT